MYVTHVQGRERTVHRNGELISMTHREFATLVYLANYPSWVFSVGQIYEEVWGEDSENSGTAVASVIGQNRRKLTPDMPKAGNLYVTGLLLFVWIKNGVVVEDLR